MLSSASIVTQYPRSTIEILPSHIMALFGHTSHSQWPSLQNWPVGHVFLYPSEQASDTLEPGQGWSPAWEGRVSVWLTAKAICMMKIAIRLILQFEARTVFRPPLCVSVEHCVCTRPFHLISIPYKGVLWVHFQCVGSPTSEISLAKGLRACSVAPPPHVFWFRI